MKARARCWRILRRLKILEEELGAEQRARESAAELTDLLRRLEENLEKLRSDPNYTPQWEREMAQDVARKLVEEGVL